MVHLPLHGAYLVLRRRAEDDSRSVVEVTIPPQKGSGFTRLPVMTCGPDYFYHPAESCRIDAPHCGKATSKTAIPATEQVEQTAHTDG